MNLSRDLEKCFRIACNSDATVLITGPTGSGKTCFAKIIHDRSSRRTKPFVSLNLATLHEGTFESALFGHERGAFTGADQRRTGRIESAQGGTLFLDEIGELSLPMQARLLEFLQTKTIVPVGGNREIRLDVRIIAATHKDLPKAVNAGTFREDLFQRLRVLCIPMKSLAQRADEFDSLMHSCLEKICKNYGRSVLRISEEVADVFERYSWPGNFRELEHVLEYAVLASNEPVVSLGDLPTWFLSQVCGDGFSVLPLFSAQAPNVAIQNSGGGCPTFSLNYHQSVTLFEKEYLKSVLQKFGWRINETARQIGLNKTTLIRRMKELQIISPLRPVESKNGDFQPNLHNSLHVQSPHSLLNG